MATQNIKRNIAGVSQTAAGGNAAVSVLTDWTNADGWIATVELTIVAHGVTSGSVNAYYRRQVFGWTDGGASCSSEGALVAATIVEEDAAWDAVVALLGGGTDVQVQMTGDAAEVINWSWSGTIYFQKVS